MAILTDEWEQKILNHIFVGGSTYRIGPSTKYLGVSTQAFTESDTAAQAIAKEPGTSGTTYNNNGYSRIAMTGSGGNFTWDNTNEVVKNGTPLNFSACTTTNWGNIQYWAIFDVPTPSNNGSLTNGIPIMIGSFSSSTTVNVGDQFRVATNDFQLEIPQTSTAKLTQLYTTYAQNNSASTQETRRGIPNLFATLGLETSGNQWQYTAKGFQQGLVSLGGTAPSTLSSTEDFISIGISTTAYDANETQGSYQEPGYASSTSFQNYNYSRPSITFNAASTDGSGVTSITNNGDITFNEASANWGSIGYWALYRGNNSMNPAATNGFNSGSNYQNGVTANRPFMTGSFSTAKTVNSGDVFRIPSGDFKISLN